MSAYFTASDANRYEGLESADLLREFVLIRKAEAGLKGKVNPDAEIIGALQEHSDFIRDLLVQRNYTPIYDLMMN
jgi:hypothetical protein